MANPPLSEAQAILTVDLDALVSNWRLLGQRSKGAECAAVIKANAYGCGIEAVAPALAKAGCRTFFVAHIGEGRRARAALDAAGIARDQARIFVLDGVQTADASGFIEATLHPVIGSLHEIGLLRLGGYPQGAPVAIHADTGMNRLGCSGSQQALAPLVEAAETHFSPAFLMSHFIGSEMPDDPRNAQQIALFAGLSAAFPQLKTSLANSSGIFLPQKPHFDLVRPGFALYGGNPTPGKPNPMRPVVRLEAPVIQIRHVEAGETAGYNARWMAQRPSRLATVGVGYADGFPRTMKGGEAGFAAHVDGAACPLAGSVSMDLTIYDVTDARADLKPGDLLTLLDGRNTVDAVSVHAGTIGYEILTRLGNRYHRVARRGQ